MAANASSQSRQAIHNVYRSLAAHERLLTDPNSTYYQAHFQAAVKRLLRLITPEQYNAWYDRRFPGDGESTRYTWKEKYEAAEGAANRLAARDIEHRGTAIAREMNVTLDEAERQPDPETL